MPDRKKVDLKPWFEYFVFHAKTNTEIRLAANLEAVVKKDGVLWRSNSSLLAQSLGVTFIKLVVTVALEVSWHLVHIWKLSCFASEGK